MVLLIIGIVLIVVSYIFALANMGHLFTSDRVDVKAGIWRHIAAGIGVIVGMALVLIGVLVLIL